MTSWIYIYTPDGDARQGYPVTRESEISCTLMGDCFIKLVFNLPESITFSAGSYIIHNRQKWSLLKGAKPESLANVNGYKYELKFYAQQHQMQRCRLFWTQGSVREVTFNLTTRLQNFAQLTCDNVNAFLDKTNNSDTAPIFWSVGDIPEHLSEKNIYQAFDGASCWDALANVCNAFGVEWWAEEDFGKKTLKLHFGKCEQGDAVEFAEGAIISKMPASKRGEDSKYGTRFYVYGGTHNIPEDYYDSQNGGTTNHVSAKRLHLPNGLEYVDSRENLQGNEVVEQVVTLDAIYPTNTETIDNVIERTETTDGVETTYYKIVCVNSPFKPSDKLATTLGAKFLTGSLMGREYDLIHAADFLTTKTFEIVARNEGTGEASIITPNEYLKPQIGDTFVLTGVKLAEERIAEAEQRLYDAALTLSKQNSADTSVYDCPTNPVHCANNACNYDLGQRVTLVGTAFGEGRISRIQGYTKKLWNEYEATYSVGDNARYSRYGAISAIDTNLKVETEKQFQTLRNNNGRVDAELKIIANSTGNSANIERKVGILIADDHDKSAREIAVDATLANRIPYLKADAFAFLRPEDFTVEVAYDGATWETLDNNNAAMRGMFAQLNNGTGFPIDGSNTNWQVGSKIRITLSPKAARNAKIDFVALNIYVNGRIFDILTEYYDLSSDKEGWYSVGDQINVNTNGISFVKYNQYFSFAGYARGGARFTFTITRNTNYWSRIVGLSGYSNLAAEITPTSSTAPYTLGTLWYWDYLKNVYFPNNIYEGEKSLGEKYAEKGDVEALASVVQDKANTSYVNNFFVRKEEAIDFAKDLTGVLEATPEEFTFRPSAGDKSIRDESAVIRRIKGNTTVWEQRVRNANFAEGKGWWGYGNGTITIDPTDGSAKLTHNSNSSVSITQDAIRTIPAGHKTLFIVDYKRGVTQSDRSLLYYKRANVSGYDSVAIDKIASDERRVDAFFLTTTDDTHLFLFYPCLNAPTGTVSTIYKVQLFDLTDLFGAGNEPTTLEEFRAVYPDDYYPYCEPEIRNVKTAAIETVGFNLYDGDYAKLIGGKTYYIGGTDIGTLTFTPNGTTASEVIELGDDRMYTPISSGKLSSTGTDLCVHFQHSGIKDGECADYVEHILELPEIAKYFPEGMNGIGNVYDEINADNAVKRFGVVDLGTIEWRIVGTANNVDRRIYSDGLSDVAKGVASNVVSNIMCYKYNAVSADQNYMLNKGISLSQTSKGVMVHIYDPDYNSDDKIDDLVASLNGVLLYYELAEPIVTPIIEPMQLAYDVEDFGTERAISPVDSAPFRADIVYQFNAEGRIRDNGRNIDKLELQVNTLDEATKSVSNRFEGAMVIADGLVDGDENSYWLPSSNATDKRYRLATEQYVSEAMPTEVAEATQLRSFTSWDNVLVLLPNIMYEFASGLGENATVTLPPLAQQEGAYDYVWMLRLPSIENSNILQYPYTIKWKDGTPPTFVTACALEIYLKKDGAGAILGEWKIYK